MMMASIAAMSLVTMSAPAVVLAGTVPAKIDAGELFGGSDVHATDAEKEIANQLGLSNTDVRITIARIIRVAMGLLGIVAVVIILIGGFTWMTAGGNDEKVGEAKKWIFAGIIGLAIILSAFAISTFVISSLITATTTAPGEYITG